MNAVTATHPAASLEVLLHHLLHTTGQEAGEETVAAAVREARGDWMQALELALPVVGLEVRWVAGSVVSLRDEARPDLPLVTWLPGPGGGWVIATGRRLRRSGVELLGIGEPDTTFEVEPRAWARVVPLLPASAMEPAHHAPPLARLFGLLRAERSDLLAVVLLAVGIGVFSLATPLAIQLLINWLAFGALLQPIVTLGIALLACLGLVAALRSVQRQAVEIVQRRLFVRALTDVSARLSRLRVEALDGQHGPELANRFFDVVTLQKAASSLLLEGLAAVLQAAVGALLLAFYHPALLAFDAVAMGLVALALVPTGRGAVRTAVVESKRKYAVAAWLEELAGRPLALRGGQLADVRTDQLANAWLTAREDHFRVVFRQFVAMQAVAVLVPVLLLVLAGWLVLEGGLTLGQLVAAEFVVTASLAGIVKLSGKLETVYDLLAGVDKLGHLLDLPIDAPRGVALDREGPARVELDGVSVGAGGPDVLSGLTLQLEPGQRRSIVGPAGSGKTLLGEVIVGARRPTAGAAILDGVPMASIRPRVLGRQTLLLRGQAAFAGTLRDNLTLGNRVPDESLWLALEAAGLAPIARRLPDGLDSELLPDGRPLGAGSQAALGVARALVCAPRLLVVDGLLDGLCPTDRARLAGLLLDPARPWTLVVLTALPEVAGLLPDPIALPGGVK